MQFITLLVLTSIIGLSAAKIPLLHKGPAQPVLWRHHPLDPTARSDPSYWLENCHYRPYEPNLDFIQNQINATTTELYTMATAQNLLPWLNVTMTKCEKVAVAHDEGHHVTIDQIDWKNATTEWRELVGKANMERDYHALTMMLGCVSVADAALKKQNYPLSCAELGDGWWIVDEEGIRDADMVI